MTTFLVVSGALWWATILLTVGGFAALELRERWERRHRRAEIAAAMRLAAMCRHPSVPLPRSALDRWAAAVIEEAERLTHEDRA